MGLFLKYRNAFASASTRFEITSSPPIHLFHDFPILSKQRNLNYCWLLYEIDDLKQQRNTDTSMGLCMCVRVCVCTCKSVGRLEVSCLDFQRCLNSLTVAGGFALVWRVMSLCLSNPQDGSVCAVCEWTAHSLDLSVRFSRSFCSQMLKKEVIHHTMSYMRRWQSATYWLGN